MPETETPAEKTMRRWYEGKLAERLLQASQMALSRNMIRRGARKQQDGTLGQPGDPSEEEPVNILIGDQIYNGPQQDASLPATTQPSSTAADLLKKAAIAAALLGGGAGLSFVPGLLKDDAPAVEPAVVDTDTHGDWELRLGD